MPIRSIGEAFTLNTTPPGDQTAARITELPGGGFVAYWLSDELPEEEAFWSGSVLRGRVFGANGRALGDDFVLNQQQDIPGMPSILALEDGGFIAQWGSGFADWLPRATNTRVFDADGSPRTDQTTWGGMQSSLTRLTDGGFVSVWTTRVGWIDTEDIHARILDAEGNPVGPDFQVNHTDQGGEEAPLALALPDGGFAIGWQTFQGSRDEGSPGEMSVRVRAFDADGTSARRDFQLNASMTLDEPIALRSLELLPDDRILATWWTYEEDGSPSVVMGRELSLDGRPLGDELPVPLDPPVEAEDGRFEITRLADGRALLTWALYDEPTDVLHAQLQDVLGNPISDEFLVDAPKFAGVDPLEDGRILITWSDADSGDGDGSASRARFFDPTAFSGSAGDDFWTGGTLGDRIAGGSGDDRLFGMAGDDRLTGGKGDDRLDGGAGHDLMLGDSGNDRLDGGAGDDRMLGGRGNDTYVVDSVDDRVTELAGSGTDTVRSSVSYALPTHVENLTLTGRAAADATGNASANVLRGNAGNNGLEGGAGRDTLIGGPGRDILDGGPGADAFRFLAAADSRPGAGRDVILHFARGQDLVDLAAIDAGRQGLDWIGRAPFSGDPGELRFRAGVLGSDLDGDGGADFEIALAGIDRLGAGDLLL